MRILLTGATGYIGQHLLKKLLVQGHELICCVRSPDRFHIPEKYKGQLKVLKVDFVEMEKGFELPVKIDVAYYLIHSMSASMQNFDNLELKAAGNFRSLLDSTECQQIIYLSGISNEKTLSKHLNSRFQVEEELRKGTVPVTVLRAGIIVGAGSASFELIRDLVEKLPIMITPKWVHTRCQPIAIENVLDFLLLIALRPEYYHQSFDIGQEGIFTYKEMLQVYAKVRNLPRRIIVLPLMTPRLSSYWLYFVTSVSYPLAVNLVDSMKIEVVCRPNNLADELGIQLISYVDAVRSAIDNYQQRRVFASWKDALSSSYTGKGLGQYYDVPKYGVLSDKKEMEVTESPEEVLNNIWSIGGKRGWYYADWLWRIRGIIDKFVGGVGLRRGRTNEETIQAGDSLDFWRVLSADRIIDPKDGKITARLLLFAEMKLPGEAWLEFKLVPKDSGHHIYQTATFRPKGLWGRIYWYVVSPLHALIFKGMLRRLVSFRSKADQGSKTDKDSKADQATV